MAEVVTFGEAMIRLSPPNFRRLEQARSPAELGEHDPALFAKVDTDGDGLLTFKEVMTNKVRAFDQGDRDDDGGLSFDEMVTIVDIETGEAR